MKYFLVTTQADEAPFVRAGLEDMRDIGASFTEHDHHPALPGDRLKAGDVLYGFCHGKFGRDSYRDKTVEHIGRNYVVVRTSDGYTTTYDGAPQDLEQYRVKPCWQCEQPLATPDSKCENGCDG